MTVIKATLAASAFVALASCQAISSSTETSDLAIVNGIVHDGNGEAGRIASIIVNDGKITGIIPQGEPLPQTRRTIDAQDLVVAPGFIDPHTHSTADLLADDAEQRANLPFLFQGVTTVVVGNDGFGSPEIAAQSRQMREQGIGSNVAFLVGLGPIREQVIGNVDRAPKPDELDQMRMLTRQGMCEGAWGFSAGLYYVPQNYAETDEVVTLMSEAAEFGGYYDTHMRDESTYSITVTGALKEALEVGKRTGSPVHIAHIKALGPAVWGQSAKMIEMIETARREGQRVTADQYPWDASGTRVSNAVVPRWALEGGLPAFRKRLEDPEMGERIRTSIVAGLARRGGADRLLITGQLGDAPVPIGLTLAEYSEAKGLGYIDGAIAILMEGDARVASFNMSEADIAAFARQDWVVTGSDGSTGHPRKYASFPKAYQDLVNGNLEMSIARFVQRSSAQTADIVGITDRGRIAVGLAADIVIFDPKNFAPRASYQSPKELSSGVRHLIVNGTETITDGQYSGQLSGRPLLKPAQCDAGPLWIDSRTSRDARLRAGQSDPAIDDL